MSTINACTHADFRLADEIRDSVDAWITRHARMDADYAWDQYQAFHARMHRARQTLELARMQGSERAIMHAVDLRNSWYALMDACITRLEVLGCVSEGLGACMRFEPASTMDGCMDAWDDGWEDETTEDMDAWYDGLMGECNNE